MQGCFAIGTSPSPANEWQGIRYAAFPRQQDDPYRVQGAGGTKIIGSAGFLLKILGRSTKPSWARSRERFHFET